jgi:uncharacterized protein
MWHASEETEHKSLALELFNHHGGSYWTRVKVMPKACYKLFSILFINQWEMLRKDNSLSLIDILKGIGYLIGPRGLVTNLPLALIVYFMPWFNPWRHDNAHLYEKWVQTNPQYIVKETT